MFESMVQQFQAFYTFPGLSFKLILLSIALALVFAAIWLVIYRLWHFNKVWWVLIIVISAMLTWTAIAFVQIPLQYWTQQLLMNWFGEETFFNWLLLTGIPIVFVSGLVQEGATLVPVIALWFSRNKQIEPLTGLYAGAISGAGFGIFEAVWVHNSMFAAGWSWQVVTLSGPSALLGFAERFFTIGFHIAISALAGYGWAKGLKWQYYLIAAGLHGLSNYAIVLLNQGTFTINQIELYMAALAIAATIYAFFVLRSSQRTEVVPLVSEIPQEPEPPDSPGSGFVG